MSGKAPSSTSNRPSSRVARAEQGGGDSGDEIRARAVVCELHARAEDRRDERGRRRLPVRRRDDRRARGKPRSERRERTGVDRGQDLARQRRASAAAGEARQPARGAGERDFQGQAHSAASLVRRRHRRLPPLRISLCSCRCAGLCKRFMSLYAVCRPDAAQTPLPRDHQHRPGRARRLPGGDPPSLLGRGHPRAAARVRRAAGALADDEGVRRRPGDDGAPADGDRALRQLEQGEAGGRAGAAPLRDAGGAPRAAAGAGATARARADGEGRRREPGLDAVEVALLAHVRLADERAQGGRLRRAGGGGAAGARDRAGRGDGAAPRAAAEVHRLGGGAQGRRVAAHRVAGLPHVRRAPRRVVDVPVPRPRAPQEEGVDGRAGRRVG